MKWGLSAGLQPSGPWQEDRKRSLPAVKHMDPAGPRSTGVTRGAAATVVREQEHAQIAAGCGQKSNGLLILYTGSL